MKKNGKHTLLISRYALVNKTKIFLTWRRRIAPRTAKGKVQPPFSYNKPPTVGPRKSWNWKKDLSIAEN